MEQNNKICNFCGKENSSSARFCIFCGKNLENKVCPNCGTEVNLGSFCPNCGTKIGDAVFNVNEGQSTDTNANSPDTDANVKTTAKTTVKAKANAKEIKKIIVNSLVLLVSLVCFIMSFLSIISCDTSSEDIIVDPININAIDVIDLGFSAMMSEKEGSRNIRKEQDIVEKEGVKYLKYTLKGEENTPEALACVKKAVVATLSATLMEESCDGTAQEANFITASILCLLHILLSFTFTAFSAWALLDSVVQYLKTKGVSVDWYKKRSPISNVAPYLAILLGLVIAIAFAIGGVSLGNYSASGISYGYGIVTIITLIAVALTACIIATVKNVKKFIFSAIVIVFTIVAIGCSFAPILNVTVEYNDTQITYEREVQLKTKFLSSFLFSKEQEKEMSEPTTVEEKQNVFNSFITSIKSFDGAEFENGDADATITELVQYLVVARDTQATSEAFNIGYYTLILFYIMAGVVITSTISNLMGKDKKRMP